MSTAFHSFDAQLYDSAFDGAASASPVREHARRFTSLKIILSCSTLALLIYGLSALRRSDQSIELFYAFPVILAVWWGNFALGILLSLEVTCFAFLNRHDNLTAAEPGFSADILGFCFYILLCSLVCRCRRTVSRERVKAATDSLTGAANGRVFYEILNFEIERFSTSAQPFTLAYLDVDDFKRVNDELGHAVGDQVLKVIVDTILVNTRRNTDTLARLGGDEFALILPQMPPENARKVLESLRQVLLERMAQHGWPVTVSIGAISFCKIPGDVEVLIDKVDSLMYRVKRCGKNQLYFEVLKEVADANQSTIERRASVRVVCRRPVRISTLEQHSGGGKTLAARTLDISATGLLFESSDQLAKGTVIYVAPVGRVSAVLAKISRTIREGRGWLYGCQFAQPLSTDELQKWLEPSSNGVRSKLPFRR